MAIRHLNRDELEAGLAHIQAAPGDDGELLAIVVRTAIDERAEPETAELSPERGLHGDHWYGGKYGPDMQVTIMNARVTDLVCAGQRERWAEAGDNLVADLDLSLANLPAGTRLALGSVVLEVSPTPHTGCGKFIARYGVEAQKFVNSPRGRELNLRGINTTVIQAGTVRIGDRITKVMD